MSLTFKGFFKEIAVQFFKGTKVDTSLLQGSWHNSPLIKGDFALNIINSRVNKMTTNGIISNLIWLIYIMYYITIWLNYV